jgi:hypothetical protein
VLGHYTEQFLDPEVRLPGDAGRVTLRALRAAPLPPPRLHTRQGR